MSQAIPFDALCLEALKAIGKTLGQMGLYRVGHPAVAASMQESLRVIREILAQADRGEVAYSLDEGKVIANGRIIGATAQMPGAILNLFDRYRLNSLTFRSGLTQEELIALCELAGLRPERAQGLDLAAYAAERGLSHIALNEAVYARVAKEAEGQPPSRSGASAGVVEPPGRRFMAELSSATLEISLDHLVRTAIEDPQERAAVFAAVMGKVRDELEAKVLEATQSLRREKTTLENEQVRTQAVLSNMAEGVVVVDDHGKVLMMNPAAEDLYGVRLVEAAGKPLSEQVKEEHLLTLASDMQVPSDRPLQADVEVLSTDDTRKTLRSSAAVVQNEAGKTVGMVAVLSDVSKHREYDRLEREFAAHVTHELRAPLSSIRAALEILQGQLMGRLQGDDEKMLGTALKNTDRLDELIRSILDFSKIESGQMTVHPQPVDPEKFLREGTESLRPWCVKKGVGLQLLTDAPLPQVLSDSGRTVQVLVNLLSNAIKFTPSGGRITVRASGGAEGLDGFLVVSVTDTGSGIAKADHNKIFEKFVQIAAGEKHVGGTGLGLAIAKALIHLQKGRMWIDSDLGKGATFYFTLPVYVPREAAAAPVPPPASWWKRLLGRRAYP